VNAAVTGVLLVAAVALGRAVGGLGSKERVVPRIAPANQPTARLAPPRGDTYPLVRGAPPPAPAASSRR